MKGKKKVGKVVKIKQKKYLNEINFTTKQRSE